MLLGNVQCMKFLHDCVDLNEFLNYNNSFDGLVNKFVVLHP